MANDLTALSKGLEAIRTRLAPDFSREYATRITAGLQDAGPVDSGTFRNGWRILPGNKTAAPSISVPKGGDTAPVQRQTPPPTAPVRPNAKEQTLYSITNVAEHGNIAADLIPGRITPDTKKPTARQDWFLTFISGGKMRSLAPDVRLGRYF